MFSMEITDIPSFMNQLLCKDTFDRFLTIEAVIRMGVTYQIDGSWNKDFFDTGDMPQGSYCPWMEVRPRVYHIVRGHKLPSSMKVILTLPEPSLDQLFGLPGQGEFRDTVSGVHLNILYNPKSLRISSGMAGHSFNLDRRPEQIADDALRGFLKKKGIC